MEHSRLQYIREQVLGTRNAALLIGITARNELFQLYETLDELEHKGLVEITENETQFWHQFLAVIHGEESCEAGLERDIAVTRVEQGLKSQCGFHLFLPV